MAAFLCSDATEQHVSCQGTVVCPSTASGSGRLSVSTAVFTDSTGGAVSFGNDQACGSETRTVVPFGDVDVTVTLPPCRVMTSRASARPSP